MRVRTPFLNIAVILSCAHVASAQATSTSMRVARHAAVASIPGANWTDAFTQATNALQTDNGTLDLACSLALQPLDTNWYFPVAALTATRIHKRNSKHV